MRVIALLVAYNEERYIANCLDHLIHHGVEAYLIDNESTDNTLKIAENYLGRGLVGIETMPRLGRHVLAEKLARKEELAATLEADWFIHMDPDEFRLPPTPNTTLAGALAEADAQGYNAVNFREFVFIPTQESPDHDHADFQKTMRWYYPFEPVIGPHRLNAWKRQAARVDLTQMAGHRVQFPGLKIYPVPFMMRHYHFLSVPHAITKLVGRPYQQAELNKGWHGWRSELRPEMITLPSQSELTEFIGDAELDSSNPRRHHYLGELVQAYKRLQSQPDHVVELETRIASLEAQVKNLQVIADVASREVENLHNAKFYKAASLFWGWRARAAHMIQKKAASPTAPQVEQLLQAKPGQSPAALPPPETAAQHREAIGKLWDDVGQLQYNFLVENGLKQTDTLLDIGCGSLRGGVHFIRYLEPGYYYGIDKDAGLLKAGRELELGEAQFLAKCPHLIEMDDFNFASLEKKFDVALAQSVFTHLPLNSIIRCLISLEGSMQPGGKFYATFFEDPNEKHHLKPIRHPQTHGPDFLTYPDKDPFHYHFDTFRWICDRTRWQADYIGNWNHPRNQKMLVFTLT